MEHTLQVRIPRRDSRKYRDLELGEITSALGQLEQANVQKTTLLILALVLDNVAKRAVMNR